MSGRLAVYLRNRTRRRAMPPVIHPAGKKRGGLRRLILAVTALAALGVLIAALSVNLRAAVEQLSLARVAYLAGHVINDSVDDIVALGEAEYDDLIRLEMDNEGEVAALKTDMVAVNRLRAAVALQIIERINSLESSELSIPLGNILGSEIFSGRGPPVPVILVPVGSVRTELESLMLTAGINQTRHRIMLTVEVDIGVLLPGFSTSTTVSSHVSVAETIIVGRVPSTYTYLEDTGRSGMEIYGDFDLDGGGPDE